MTRCPKCDRPEAPPPETDAIREHLLRDRSFIAYDAIVDLHTRGFCTATRLLHSLARETCDRNKIDWRGRALTAEARIVELQSEITILKSG